MTRRFVVVLCVVPLMAARQPASVTGDWVARQIDARDTGRDARFELEMRLVDRQGRVRERRLTMLGLRAREGSAPGVGDRILLRFTYPNDIKGTSFLVWENPKGEDQRFLYLPALGRVRRVSGAESQESFVGTDFTYEEIGGRELEDYTYALLAGAPAWRDADGRAHEVYRLESRARDRDAVYPRAVSLVRKDTYVVVHAEIHNRRDERQKTYEVRRLERIENVWTVMSAVMTDHAQGTRTELEVARADYNVGLTDDHFSRRELERQAGR